MNVQISCETMKRELATRLQAALEPKEKTEIVLAAFYEMSRAILPELGSPRKEKDYLEAQETVSELISFLAVSLLRSGQGGSRCVATLTEIAEGCPDPLLEKKLLAYAQRLLSASACTERSPRSGLGRRTTWLLLLVLGLTAALFRGPGPQHSATKQGAPAAVARRLSMPVAAVAAKSVPTPSPRQVSEERVATSEPEAEPPKDRVLQSVQEPPAGADGEQATKIRVVNSQVLVPVTFSNGAETIQVELVLDTGATKSTIREEVARRLRIDQTLARPSLVEMADGRVVTSANASIDALTVGPFTVARAELAIIPYQGSQKLYDGLLGMDFLSKHRYELDLERKVIRWL